MSYKKTIIHTIKECWEEEDTPEATEIDTELNAPETYEAKRKIGNIFTTVKNENTPIAIELRMDLRNYFTKLNSMVNSYVEVKGYEAGKDEADYIKASLPEDINKLKILILAWLRPEQLEEISNTSIAYFNKILTSVDSIYAGGIVTTDQIANEVTALAKSYRNFNQFALTQKSADEILYAYFTTVINQATARRNKDWEGEHNAEEIAYKIAVEGEDPGNRSMADVISMALIEAQAWRFV
jgi:hypothetical protein